MNERVRVLHTTTTQGVAGVLSKDGQHVFAYDSVTYAPAERPDLAISLTMPPRAESWKTANMLPAFQTFLPEGFLKDHIRARFAKTLRIDDMALLALSGENAIGRIRVCTQKAGTAGGPKAGAESLQEILADQGSRDLFEYLCDKYLMSTSIAGVQPKVVVPVAAALADNKPGIGERSTLRGRQLIVKVDGPDYPGVSENEYHCLSIARSRPNRFTVPEFHLSEDRQRLAIERFDIDAEKGYLGFEDMVALQGKVNDEKYEGSYENVAMAIRRNCSHLLLPNSLERYFASVVLAVAVRNGDAHLKNFGLLYTNPLTEDCRLSPLFDQVCTTIYIPKDLMALRLAKSKNWPDRSTLERFGRDHCDIASPAELIDEIVAAVVDYRPAIAGPMWERLKATFESSAAALGRTRIFVRDRPSG